jgi:murein DD-endopeptidase MepM/ murein hydrolase activator NlpD
MHGTNVVTGIVVAAVVLGGCASAPPPQVRETISVPGGWPLPAHLAVVTSSFAEARGPRRHQGLDLAAPKGTSVRATAGGVVTLADRSGDWGRLVVIEHGGGWETRYAHLSHLRVERGERVVRGQEIGTVGRTGNATGYHLHYEVRQAGQALDPWPTLRR